MLVLEHANERCIYVIAPIIFLERIRNLLPKIKENFRLREKFCPEVIVNENKNSQELVVIVDEHLGINEIYNISYFARKSSGRCKLVMVVEGYHQLITTYLREGFVGFINLSEFEDDIKKCLTILQYNGIFVNTSEILKIFSEYISRSSERYILSKEVEIAKLIVDGKTYKEISNELSINYRQLVGYIGKIRRDNCIDDGRLRIVEYFRSIIA